MKQFIYILCFLLILSCKEDKGLTDQERDQEEIKKEQAAEFLQNAYTSRKKIVSVGKESAYWNITFSDNYTAEIPESAIKSLDFDTNAAEYIIVLYDDQTLTFNTKEIIYPTGIVALTQDIKFMKNTEISIEFRVNPSNAIFNYNVNSEDCQIELDMVKKINTYSYVTNPDDCHITRIEQVRDEAGKIKEGQYKAYIRDNGGEREYKYTTAIVLSLADGNGDPIQLSSSAISLERKKDSGLPIVVIHTENNADIKDRDNWISATMKIDGIGQFDDYEGALSIRGRGNSTWGYPKKPFAIRLDSKSEILGMPSHRRWVLLANYMDRTLMRNSIAFEIAKITDLEWTPRGQFVEVMLNDVHLGNYYLCEHIKIDENRVNIEEMQTTDISGESVTGGYLIEMDTYYDEVNKFKSEICDLPVMIKEPEDIRPQQFMYIQNYVNTIERLLHSDDFAKTREYTSYIDDVTFADWWIIMELVYNFEAQHPKSCFFHKKRSGLLKAGPVWDFDYGTFINRYDFCNKNSIWYTQLFKDPAFVNLVKARWAKFKPQFEKIASLIEEQRHDLTISAELNDAMWNLSNSNAVNGDEQMSFHDAILLMKKNYEERIEWLDIHIQGL